MTRARSPAGRRPSPFRLAWLFHYLDVIGGCLIEVLNEGDHDVEKAGQGQVRHHRSRTSHRGCRSSGHRRGTSRRNSRDEKPFRKPARAQSRGEQGLSGPRGIPGAQAAGRASRGARGARRMRASNRCMGAEHRSRSLFAHAHLRDRREGRSRQPDRLIPEAYHAATSPDDEE